MLTDIVSPKNIKGDIMRTYLKFLAVICLLAVISSNSVIHANEINVSAKAAVLIEASGGSVIYEKNSRERLPMASTTKIMTAIVALESAETDRTVIVSEKACGVEGSSIYLSPNEALTLEDLLYALMLESANDAAAAIAYEIAGGIDEFASMMNETAAKIGLSDTNFTNPHGLDNEDHYTTAYDLAKLTAYALQNDVFRKIVSTYKHQIPLRGDEGVRVLINHNRLLKMSENAIGVKTGFTKRSGRCLVSAAQKDGVCIVAVTLNDPDDWRDHLSLHRVGLSAFKTYQLASPGDFSIKIPCPSSDDGYLSASNTDEFKICAPSDAEITHVIEAERMVFPPVESGEAVGKVSFYSENKKLGEILLYASESVEEAPDTRSLIDKILDKIR